MENLEGVVWGGVGKGVDGDVACVGVEGVLEAEDDTDQKKQCGTFQ